MKKFSEILALIGIKPKTLDQANATIDAAQPALNSVSALFAAAGMDLDAELAKGPNALKDHIAAAASADKGALETANASVTDLKVQLSAKTAELATAKAETATANANYSTLCASVNFDPAAKDAEGKPVEFKAAFGAHVKKEAAAVLAKDGRAPLPHVPTPAPGKEQKKEDTGLTGRDRYAADFREQLKNNPNLRSRR